MKSMSMPRGRSRSREEADCPAFWPVAFGAAAGLIGMLLAGTALAQVQPATPAQVVPRQLAQAQETADFNIPAQALSSALIAYGSQSGYQVSIASGSLADLQSSPVSGRLTADEALRRLLGGTGVTWRFADNRSVVLSRVAAGAGVVTLDPVNIDAQRVAPPTSVLGNLQPVYAGGQMARGGSLGLLGSNDVMDTPFSTVNYTAEMIENQQARTAADTLINDPSVRLTTGSNGFDDTFQIRGFAVGSGDVGFNGLYGLISSNRVPAQVVERIELLKGPGALINGIAPGNSVGGGINIISKRAGDEPLTRLTSTYISEANFGVHTDVSRRYGPDKAFGIRFNGLYRDGEASIDNGNVNNGVGALNLDYRGERVRLSVDGIYQKDDTDNFRPQISLLATNTRIPSPPDNRGNWYPGTTLVQNDKTIATRLEYDITESLTAFAGVGYRDATNDQVFPVSGPAVDVNGNFGVRSSYYDSYSETLSGSAGARWRFDTAGIGHTLNFSYTGFQREEGNAYIQAASTVNSNIYRPLPLSQITLPRTAPMKSAETTLTSMAVADTLSFANDRVLVTGGVREQNVKVDSYNTTTGAFTSSYDSSATSPLAAIVIKPWQNVSLYSNYAEGLSRGTIVGAGYSNTGAVLAPYKSEQLEVGVKVDWGKVTTTAAVYQLSRPNSIRTASNALAYDGEQRNRGLELSAYGEIVPGLRGIAGAAFVEPKLTKTATVAEIGNDAAGVPRTTFSGGLDWDTPWVRGLALNGRMVYTSGSYLTAANTVKFDDWMRFDIGARYRTEIGGRGLVLRANLENVFDEAYWLTTGTYVTVGAPRTVVLSATLDF